MALQSCELAYIARLASHRNPDLPTKSDDIELFDSIDSLGLEELSELYAVVVVGRTLDASKYQGALAQGKSVGFGLVSVLIADSELGQNIPAGAKALRIAGF